MNLGELLKSRREAAGLTLQDLADACSLSKSYVWDCEAGKTVNIGLLTAIRLSVALSLPVSAMCAAALESTNNATRD